MRKGTAGSILLGTLLGLAIGIGIYTFVYAKGASYLTNDPGACANCHIMQDQYDGWQVSAHRSVAVCNDCHTPPGLVPKYVTKASNGFWHSYAFTTGDFHEPIRIKESNRKVTEKACRKCHEPMVLAIEGPAGPHRAGQEIACLRCHSDVGHQTR
ncbi:MAG TPA: cytochrome c nitrite reductase small subunit [Thermoanaerobaculia bacterium]|nr:cytochrome c nitrite reductase small subunit [Thermoanaerobaculia bacterium]